MLSVKNEWAVSINIKGTFKEDPSDIDIKQSSMRVVFELKRIRQLYPKILEDNYLDNDLETIIDDFSRVIQYIIAGDKAEDCDALNSWKSWKDAFNEYLAMLYDLADQRVTITGDRRFSDGVYRFMWVR